jgi:hypothetical protein
MPGNEVFHQHDIGRHRFKALRQVFDIFKACRTVGIAARLSGKIKAAFGLDFMKQGAQALVVALR